MKRKWMGIAVAAAAVMLLGTAVWMLDLPGWVELDMEKIYAMPASTTVYDGEGRELGALGGRQERLYAELEEIPEHVRAAFIAAEDRRFYSHSGVDVKRIFGALWQDVKTLRLEQGASTITQQLIKLTHLSSEKTISRKVQEMVLARRLERRMSKDDILEAYLNTVYFGGGAYGIGSAAEVYFGKEAGELSLAEGALLAGIIKSPSNYAPHLKPENALKRRNMILDTMLEDGIIGTEEHAAAREEGLRLVQAEADGAAVGWYGDLILSEAEQILKEDAEGVLSGGYHIYTALDSEMQAAAEELFADGGRFPDPAEDGTPVQAALIAMDVEDGGIRAVVGGREYEVERGLNRAVQMQRQPGSAIKPISTYAAAIEDYGFLPTSIAQDVQREFAGKYLPGNAGGNYYGAVTLREALSRSLNVATVDIAELIGVPALRRTLAKFGVPLSAQDVNLSLALGSMTDGVSPARLCAAYCALGNGGMQVKPHAVVRITSSTGRLIYEAAEPVERAVSGETAFLVTDMLRTAATGGSARALSEAGVPVAGKTGTVGESGGGNRDIWTAAYTPELAVTVWMGFDEPGSGHAMADYAGGSSYPARMCAEFLKKASGRLSGGEFEAPEGLSAVRIDAMALEELKEVCLAAANTPAEYCRVEYFREGELPVKVSTLWSAPEAVDDLSLLPGDVPVVAFTSKSEAAEYLVLRRSEGEMQIAAVLAAPAGEVIIWQDSEADAGESHSYSVLPRHRLLYESGTLLTGMESASVEYSPAGLWRRLFG